MGVGHGRSGSRGHDEGETQAVALELMRWEWDTGGQARIDTVEAGDKRSGSN